MPSSKEEKKIGIQRLGHEIGLIRVPCLVTGSAVQFGLNEGEHNDQANDLPTNWGWGEVQESYSRRESRGSRLTLANVIGGRVGDDLSIVDRQGPVDAPNPLVVQPAEHRLDCRLDLTVL